MRVVRLYYLFQFFFTLLLWVPVFYEVQKRVGISDRDIFSIQSIYYFAFLLFEIPTGFLADRWSKLGCLKLGSLVLVSANLLPVLCPHYGGFLWHFLLVALSRSLISGASSAYLYDYLSVHGKPQAFKLAEGRARAYSLAGKVVFWAMVGTLMKWQLMLPYSLSALASAVAVGISWMLPALASHSDVTAGVPRSSRSLGEAWAILKGEPRIALVILQGVAIFVFSRICQINLFQPILLARHFDLATHGMVMGVITVFEALGSGFGTPLEKRLGHLHAVYLLTLILAFSMSVMALPSLGQAGTWVGLIMLSYATGLAYPVQRQLLNDTIPDSRFRATFLSLESLIDRGVNSLVLVWFGSFVAEGKINEVLFLSTGFCVFLVVVVALGFLALKFFELGHGRQRRDV